jgi:predicted sugar kinase
METLEDSLYARVDELIKAHKSSRLLSTTGTQMSIAELALRTEGLELALRELAQELEKLAASRAD